MDKLGYDALVILRDILINLGKKEMSIENLRCTLCSIHDFDPYLAFKRILNPSKSGVLEIDHFYRFMLENGFDDLNRHDY